MNRVIPIVLVVLVLAAGSCRRAEVVEPPAAQMPPQTATAPPPAATDTSATGTVPKAAAPEVVNGPTLFPVDEGASDASFRAYRERLLAAIRAADADAVVALADPAIRTSFGGGGGAAELRRVLDRPGMWAEVEQVMTLGGTFRGDAENRMFWAPYVYSAWPEERDAFAAVAVIREGLPLLERPDESSPAVATLNYDIVQRISPPAAEPRPWIEVRTSDGRSGFVPSSAVRSPVGYRAGFTKRSGEWKMTALVAGD